MIKSDSLLIQLRYSVLGAQKVYVDVDVGPQCGTFSSLVRNICQHDHMTHVARQKS